MMGSTKFTESTLPAKETAHLFVAYKVTEAAVRFNSCIVVVFLPDDIGETEWTTSKPECRSENSIHLGFKQPHTTVEGIFFGF